MARTAHPQQENQRRATLRKQENRRRSVREMVEEAARRGLGLFELKQEKFEQVQDIRASRPETPSWARNERLFY